MVINNKIWDTYNKTKDPSVREKLILEYLPVVKIVAGQMSVRLYGHVELEDLVSYGIFGLIDAIDKYDPGKGVKFETYASLRIKGAIIDNVRRLDWVPRTLRQDKKKLEQAFKELEDSLGREPSDGELAERLGLTLEETREFIKKSTLATFVSFDDYLEQNHEAPTDMLNIERDYNNPESELLRAESKKLLTSAIEKLSEKEKLVLTLYYYEEFTLKEISKILNVTESRVSQIHSKGIFKLKLRLGNFINP